MGEPFVGPQTSARVSIARAAPADGTNDFMQDHEVGEEAYSRCDRLEANIKPFHDKLPSNKLKMFSTLSKKKSVKSQDRTIILKADKALFGRIILIAQSHQLHLADVMCHPLGPMPWALVNTEGLLCKTSKPAFPAALDKNLSQEQQLSQRSATLIDGMSIIQKVKGN